jgi:basic membrane lipoprotein Med (substrate-binding protein (PBP1-ABC) superfamily)
MEGENLMKLHGGYTVIQNADMYEDMPSTCYRLLNILNSLCWGNENKCWPSEKTLASLMHRSTRTVQRCIKWLVDNSKIKRIRRGSISNIYVVLNKIKRGKDKAVKKIEDTIKKVKNSSYSKKTSNFNNFKPRQYNFNSLENMLLGTMEYNEEKLNE